MSNQISLLLYFFWPVLIFACYLFATMTLETQIKNEKEK